MRAFAAAVVTAALAVTLMATASLEATRLAIFAVCSSCIWATIIAATRVTAAIFTACVIAAAVVTATFLVALMTTASLEATWLAIFAVCSSCVRALIIAVAAPASRTFSALTALWAAGGTRTMSWLFTDIDRDRGIVATIVGRNLLSGQAFDTAQQIALGTITQRDRVTFRTSARSAANAVDISLRHLGQLVIDDVGDAVNVDATRGDVRCHKYTDLGVTEGFERYLTLALALVAVNGNRWNS